MEFTSWNIHGDPSARQRWVEAGSPSIPYLQMADGRGVSLLHPSQAASLLELDATLDIDLVRYYWDIGSILEAWVDVVRPLDWTALTDPTPSRDRSIIDLLTNAIEPMTLIQEAWETERFPGRWDDLEDQVKESLVDPTSVVAYAERVHNMWIAFGLEHFSENTDRDPLITDPEKGTVPFSTLLATHRWHCGFHLRQVILHLVQGPLSFAGNDPTVAMQDLDLPDDVFT